MDSRVAFKLGQWLRYVDDFDGARARHEEAEQQARDEGDESSLANILLNQLIVETWSGNWAARGRAGDEMILAFEQQGVASGDVRLWRTYVDAHLGQLEAVRAAAAEAPQQEPVISMIWSRWLGLAELAHGETEPASRTSPRRWKSSSASTFASRPSGAATATRSRRQSNAARSIAPSSGSRDSSSAAHARASRGAGQSRRAAVASYSPPGASSTPPHKRSSRRSSSTRHARCRSSRRGRCSFRVRSCAG